MRHFLSRALSVATIAVLIVAARPASAHHAVQAEFDQNKKATITGTLTRVMWVNPHVRWQLEVKDPKTGKVESWDLTGGAPSVFRPLGISGRDVFKVGETYSVWVAMSRDGSKTGHVFAFELPD